MVGKLKGKEHALKDIFCTAFEFSVPNYQRPYAWHCEHAAELVDDLIEFFEQKEKDSTDSYFLGSIVLIKDENGQQAQIVDGQQRLTTITMLLAAIAYSLPPQKQEEYKKYFWEPGREFEEIESKPRLKIREKDQVFFQKYIQELGFDKLIKLSKNHIELDNDAKKNIRSNCLMILRKLRTKFNGDVDNLINFGKFLVNECCIVEISTPDKRSAFRVFSILNDRGLNLQQSDIIKSDIIGNISEERQEIYTNLWEKMEDEMGRKKFNELFGHIRMIYTRKKGKDKIIEDIREFFYINEQNKEKLMDNVIVPYVNSYSIIKNSLFPSENISDSVNDILTSLNRITHSDWIPPAMLFLTNYSNQENEILKFLSKLERLTAYMYICSKGINSRIKRYAKIIDSLGDRNMKVENVEDLELSESEKKSMREVLNAPIYNVLWPPIRNYILFRLNTFLSDGIVNYNYSKFTVEHVLPQNAEADSEWNKQWPEREREYWVHRLANLIPVTISLNNEAMNYDFKKKKQIYFNRKSGVPSFALTNELRDMETWSPSDVQERQNKLMEVLVDKWEL